MYSDLLCNIRLLSFIDIDIIDKFIDTLQNKYNKNFFKFFKYFKKNFVERKPFCDMDWNYNKIIINNDNEQIYFFTNNIVESTNRTINLHYGGNIKSLLNFKNC